MRLKHTSTTSYSRFCSLFDQQNLQRLSWQKFRTEAVTTGQVMVFAEAFGLVHPAQKFDMYQKLNQRSWHLMTYSNKHSNWTGWGLKVTIHSHASFHEQIIAASLTSKSTLSVTILQGFIQTVLASANRFQLNNDPQENVLMHVCLLQASSWSTWPVFYLNCCVYYSLNSGLRKLSAAHETSCTFHFRKKEKPKTNPPS